MDLTGSGIETVAHVRENGRLTLMFRAFQGRPRILRLQGRARVVEPEDDDWDRMIDFFPPYAGRRSIVVLQVERIADSCGYSVPLYQYAGERTQLVDWADRKGPEGLAEYKSKKNRRSIDGLPGLKMADSDPLSVQFLYNYLAFLGGAPRGSEGQKNPLACQKWRLPNRHRNK